MKRNSTFMRVTIVAAWLMCSTPAIFAQSIGFNVVSNSVGGIDDAEGDALLPTDLAGVPAVTPAISGAQTNWNNISRYGSGTFVLTNSLGGTNVFDMQWDSGYSDATGSGAGLGTPDGMLMNSFMTTWGPGNATPLGNSCYSSPINDKPIVYVSGLNSWYTNIPNAEGYGVVLYTTGYSYWETAEGYVESVNGSPLSNTMVEGSDLAPHLWEVDNSVFTGTYIPTTSTDSGSPTYGGNYMFFNGLTNDAILIRLQSHGYGAGLNGFQFVPIFPTLPTPTDPAFSPSSTVYALQPVTVTETATGDPFHTNLWYQWQIDTAQSGTPDHNIPDATNATLNVLPTNATAAYTISYDCIVSNIFGVVTSSVGTLTVNPAVLPFLIQDTTPGPGNGASNVFAYVGGTISFTAVFGGTPPTYLWQSNSVNIPGATSTTLTIGNLQLSASANYDLTATNSVGGIASTPAPLTVLADLPAPDASVTYPYDVFTNGPIAYWRFNETIDSTTNSVQAYDYSGYNNNATYGNATADNQPGPQPTDYPGFESTNTAVTLVNGIPNSCLIAPSLNLNTNTVTITAWINPSSELANNGIFMWKNGSDKAGFGFGGNTSGGLAELGYTWDTNNPATTGFHSALFPPLNQWSFVALTITPTSSTIYLYYIDSTSGVTNLLKAVQNINNLSEPFSGGNTWIGSDTSESRNFSGSIDEVAVFNKALTEQQLQDLFLKAIGATGVAPTISPTVAYPTNTVYSGQNVRLSVTNINGTIPMNLQWQASPDGSTWTNIPGANASTCLVNPLFVGNVYYQLTANNSVGSGTSAPVSIAFTALPATPAGQWTANFQITNNILGSTAGNSGLGHYTGRGILGTGNYWNPMPDLAGVFQAVNNLTSVSDLEDDGVTHSGIYCSLTLIGGFTSASEPQPDSSDIGNLLYQMVQCWTFTNGLQFHGVPDGTYNVCFYGSDGSYADRGTTFVVHDPKNGDQSAGTVNASPIIPLQQGVNFVVFSNVHVSGGTLYVDVLPTTPLPTHPTNNETEFNGAQMQLVSYDPPAAGFSGSPTNIFVSQSVTFVNTSSGSSNWVWNFGDGNTLSTNSSANVSHAYATAGTYTVSLIATGPLGTAGVTNAGYVVVLPKPVIGNAKVSGGNFVLSGANGAAGAQYRVLTSTNMALPLASWTPAWTNVFAPDGTYGYTNSSMTNNRSFFILISP